MGTRRKVNFVLDTHYYSESLGSSGRAYELRSGSDQKCLAESRAIVEAAFAKLADSDTDAVLIPGYITKYGELVCHQEFRELLYTLREKKPVYLTTATHDWCCDENPRRYEGEQVFHDVETMPVDTLRDYYYDFGPGGASAEFVTHLGESSYTVELSDAVRLLALNDDQNGKGRAGYTPEHFDWIEAQIRQAKEDGKLRIVTQQHLLLPHVSPLITGGACVGDREEAAARLADAGLRFMFVGHSHMQHIMRFTSPAGNPLVEVNVGALSGYPAPMVHVVVEDGRVRIDTEHLDRFVYRGRELGQDFLKEHACALLTRPLQSAAAGDKAEFRDRMSALQMNGEKIAKYFFLIKPLARYLNRASVPDLAKKLRLFTLGKAASKEEIAAFPE
ncbi:MAG: metallophosphoesterase [Clostridiales bacterium]|nr:metallophosphoesterase [Clostridiales bacterium]